MAETTNKKPAPEQPKKTTAARPEGRPLLAAALLGALIMNAVLLGITYKKPATSIVTIEQPQQTQEGLPTLPADIPDAERHIDVLLGLADTARRQNKLEEAREFYTIANRAFGASIHAAKLRMEALQQADQLFEEKEYAKARLQYQSFVCIADALPKEEQVLIQKATFRVAECYLREALTTKGKNR